MRRYPAISVFITIILTILSTCSSGGDSGDIAKALEDRLTEALDFEGGTLTTGSPPNSSSNTDAPRILDVESPDVFHIDTDFMIALTSPLFFVDDVETVIVHVQGANKHIRVSKAMSAGEAFAYVRLPGVLRGNDSLSGSFKLRFALQTAGGVTGPYSDADIQVPEEYPEPECEDGICCNSESWVEDGGFCVSDVDDLGCTLDLCNEEHQCIASLVSETCLIEEGCAEAQEENPENACLICKPDETTDSWTAKENGTLCDAGEGPESGNCLDGQCANIEGFLAGLLLSDMEEATDGEGSIKTGQLPEGQSGEEAPQIVKLTAPAELRVGALFGVILISDFTDYQNVDKALIHVAGGEKYLEIPVDLESNGDLSVVELSGFFTASENLKGHQFTLRFALGETGGKIGEFVETTFNIPDDEPECELDICCNGGSYVPEGSHCLAIDSVQACARRICADDHICETRMFEDGTSCNDGSGPVSGECMQGICESIADGDTEQIIDGDKDIDLLDGDLSEEEMDHEAIQICLPGSKRCEGAHTVAICNESGTSWETNQACAAETVCQGGICVPISPDGDVDVEV